MASASKHSNHAGATSGRPAHHRARPSAPSPTPASSSVKQTRKRSGEVSASIPSKSRGASGSTSPVRRGDDKVGSSRWAHNRRGSGNTIAPPRKRPVTPRMATNKPAARGHAASPVQPPASVATEGVGAELGQRADPGRYRPARSVTEDHAARVEQVEQVAGLDALVVGRVRPETMPLARARRRHGAPARRRWHSASRVLEMPQKHLGLGRVEVVAGIFLLRLAEDIAISLARWARRGR